jgi:adenylate cyclase
MDFRKARLPAVIVGVAVFAAAFAAWIFNLEGLRTGLRAFATDVALPWLAAAAEPWSRVPAEFAETIRARQWPPRPPWADAAEIVAAIALGGLAILLAAFRRPLAATVVTLLLCIAWMAVIAALLLARHAAIDIAGPPALALLAFVPTAIVVCISDRRRAQAVCGHFRHHLPPDAIRRIVDDPSAAALAGEYREVTVLFADIDGFTALAERANPVEVVQVLDGYLEVVTAEVHAHGGMIDRRYGDGVFALFNAPLDLDDHPRRAIACARALVAATETYRQTPLPRKLKLGRTRIGIETGPVIAGDVGGGRAFDYAVHGIVMVTAPRLEIANKALGTAICVGPGAAARLDPVELVLKGSLAARGSSPSLQVYTPALPAQAPD